MGSRDGGRRCFPHVFDGLRTSAGQKADDLTTGREANNGERGQDSRQGAGAEMGQAARGANNAASSAIASRPCRTATLRAARPLGKGG